MLLLSNFYTLPHDSGGYYGIMLVIRVFVHLSVCLLYISLSVFLFPHDNLSKCQWIFTKLGMCIEIVEIYFGIANGQILFIFEGDICPRHIHISGIFVFR